MISSRRSRPLRADGCGDGFDGEATQLSVVYVNPGATLKPCDEFTILDRPVMADWLSALRVSRR